MRASQSNSARRQPGTREEFVAGYYCAVATLIARNRCVSVEARELFRAGANEAQIVASVGEYDLNIFQQYGLVP